MIYEKHVSILWGLAQVRIKAAQTEKVANKTNRTK